MDPATRAHHDELEQAIDRLDRAVAAAAPRRPRAWSERVRRELEGLREAIRSSP